MRAYIETSTDEASYPTIAATAIALSTKAPATGINASDAFTNDDMMIVNECGMQLQCRMLEDLRDVDRDRDDQQTCKCGRRVHFGGEEIMPSFDADG